MVLAKRGHEWQRAQKLESAILDKILLGSYSYPNFLLPTNKKFGSHIPQACNYHVYSWARSCTYENKEVYSAKSSAGRAAVLPR